MRVLPTALFAILLAAASASAAEIAPGAVAHQDAVFAALPRGGVGAFDAATGGRRWTAAEAARPLAADRTRLLAQAESERGLRLLLLDTASGRVLADSVVDLPEGVTAPVDDTGEVQFRIRVEQAGAQVRLDWTWEFRPLRGAVLEEEGGAEEPSEARGAVLADLATGRASVVAAREAEGLERLPVVLAHAADSGAFRERPRRVGALLVATQAAVGRPSLKRWTQDGIALPDVALPEAVTLQLGADDGRHVLVSREIGGAPLAAAHEWTVVALDTGTTAATLRTSTAAAGFAVTGGRVVLAHREWEHRAASGWQREPRRLEAFDRATGARVWTQEIRNTEYRGPVAP